MPVFTPYTAASVQAQERQNQAAVQQAVRAQNVRNVGAAASAASQDLAQSLRAAGVSEAEINSALRNGGVSPRAGNNAIGRSLDAPIAAAEAGREAAVVPNSPLPDLITIPDMEQRITSGLDQDNRVRLRAQPGQKNRVYGEPGPDNILSILHQTGGVLFPYTPSITVEQSVDYKTVELVHANGDINAYSRTPSISIGVTGKFTVQNQREGEYLIAVLHFLRVVSKMHFGEQDPNAGLPPPVLNFSGYGPYMFRSLKCVLKSHSYSLEDTVDYVDIKTADGLVNRLPSMLTITLGLGIQNTPTEMRSSFNLAEFRTGELMRSSKGWI